MWQTFAITTDHVENTTATRVVVRSHAVGYADGTTLHWHRHDWHQLVYASAGVLNVETRTGAWVVPPARAVWLPAGVEHRLIARGRTQLRTIYVARSVRAAPRALQVMQVSPLLRELILHIVDRGQLDARDQVDARLLRVLLDQLASIDVVAVELREPSDAVARAAADLLRAEPGRSLAAVAHEAGASVRTLERRFAAETGSSLGRWRQRLRLTRALELLAAGMSVSEAGLAVGYATTSAFVAAFKRELGSTPGRYFAAG